MSNRVTIKDIPTDIVERLRVDGISRMGNQYLLVGYMLDQAGIIPDLIRAYEQSEHDKSSLLDAIEKAVRVGRIFSDESVDEQEPKKEVLSVPEIQQTKLTFGA